MNEIIKEILKAPIHVIEGIKYHMGGSLYIAKPRMIQFPVCDRCNARCIMCNRWEKETANEISLEKIKEVFRGDLFSEVEFAGLHGGEPTLRSDLAAISKTVQDACPKLKQLWISTNGFGVKRVEKRISEVLDVLDFSKLKTLDVNVSIDGPDETHERIRGIKGGFKQCVETLEMLSRLAETHPLKLSIGTVIQPLNLHELEKMEKLARDFGVTHNFQPLMFDDFFNVGGDPDLMFGKDGMEEFKELVKNKLSREMTTTGFYWRDFLSMTKGAHRKSPCAFDRYVFSLYPTGEVLPCSREDWIKFGNVYEEGAHEIWYGNKAREVREKMKRDVCPRCSNYCGVEFSLQKEFFTYAGDYLKRILSFNSKGKGRKDESS